MMSLVLGERFYYTLLHIRKICLYFDRILIYFDKFLI